MDPRRPKSSEELRDWLRNMVWHHHYGDEEISAATGLSLVEVSLARSEFSVTVNNRPPRPKDSPILVLPYPGGRHPRIQGLEKAIRPRRESKASVFAPWDDSSYVVVDLPEAISSSLGLLYLAHEGEPTLWSRQRTVLEPLEWRVREKGGLEIERRLPNGVRFGAAVAPVKEVARMEFWVANGTSAPLSDVRLRMCALLKGMSGFEQLTLENKVFAPPYAACRSSDGKRWVVTAWEECERTWGDPLCPCIHSDPKLPDLPPGETRMVRGWLSFYQGTDIQGELRRIEAIR